MKSKMTKEMHDTVGKIATVAFMMALGKGQPNCLLSREFKYIVAGILDESITLTPEELAALRKADQEDDKRLVRL